MKEKLLLKQIIEDKLADKEVIRQRVLADAENWKGADRMKRKLVIATLTLGLVVAMSYGVYAAAESIEYHRAEDFLAEIGVEAGEFSRSQAKAAYRDMRSGEFNQEITEEILAKRANELGIEYVPAEAQHVYRALKNYSALTYTNRVSQDQIQALEAGLPYGEIIDRLGVTKDVGKDVYILQYLVDGTKLLTLSFADENEICPLSGIELLATLKKVATENNTEFTFDAVVLQVSDGRLLVDCPAYGKFDCASVGITDKTRFATRDGQAASFSDIISGAAVTITYDGTMRESYPVQITATELILGDSN